MQIDKELFPEATKPLIDLLNSEDWPEAAPTFLICEETEQDKLERAEGIVDYLNVDLAGKRVLDFGCGEGHVSQVASKTAALSVGYDLNQTGSLPWESDTGAILTTDFSRVTEQGPYDVVLLYDVLDHCDNPVAVLEQVASVATLESKIVIRCHSWMSRHGGHLYRQLNKAYIHLVFTPEELKLMGLELPNLQKYYFPINTHQGWFKEAGFEVVSHEPVKTSVERFFHRPKIVKRLPLDQFKGEFPEWQMSQSFNDYVLKKK
jgi:2-polyprenyl-3-methyl-5-hydroxy-6-metoxy-1,4-benzoquinol methylase